MQLVKVTTLSSASNLYLLTLYNRSLERVAFFVPFAKKIGHMLAYVVFF